LCVDLRKNKIFVVKSQYMDPYIDFLKILLPELLITHFDIV